MNLHIITTGGTFDKHYDAISGQLTFADSHLPQAIARARITSPVTLSVLPLLDSLEMQECDRQRILEACRVAVEPAIVIIHGTDTMAETAQVLGPAALNKTIILTGAMVPYEITDSDALFNLGFAVGVAQTLTQGVYVAMNGQVFAWDRVQKNRRAGVFEAVSSS